MDGLRGARIVRRERASSSNEAPDQDVPDVAPTPSQQLFDFGDLKVDEDRNSYEGASSSDSDLEDDLEESPYCESRFIEALRQRIAADERQARRATRNRGERPIGPSPLREETTHLCSWLLPESATMPFEDDRPSTPRKLRHEERRSREEPSKVRKESEDSAVSPESVMAGLSAGGSAVQRDEDGHLHLDAAPPPPLKMKPLPQETYQSLEDFLQAVRAQRGEVSHS